LASWTDDFKEERLNEVKDRHARNLLKKLLNKDPERRPVSIAQVLAHPFISGHKPVRMEGEEAEFDAFLSYRVAADFEHVERMYHLLTEAGLKIWWDKKCLQPGVDWEQGFCDGLARSRNFIAFISRNAIKHREKDFNNYEHLKPDSSVDNVLLEHRMALELRKMGLIEKMFPIMVGDTKPDGSYSNYFGSGCHPGNTPEVVVSSIELTLKEHFNRLELELPYDTINAGMTAAETLKLLLKNQGGFVEGDREVAFRNISDTIVQMCRGGDHSTSKMVITEDEAADHNKKCSEGQEVLRMQRECERLNRLMIDRDTVIECHQKKYQEQQKRHEEELEALRNAIAEKDAAAALLEKRGAMSGGGKGADLDARVTVTIPVPVPGSTASHSAPATVSNDKRSLIQRYINRGLGLFGSKSAVAVIPTHVDADTNDPANIELDKKTDLQDKKKHSNT
jgi:hypothetical protein